MTARVPLPERIDLATTADLHASFLSHTGAPMVLDASATKQISTPAIQLFLSAAKTWRGNGDSLTIEGPSAKMIDQLAMAGLTLDDISSPASEAS